MCVADFIVKYSLIIFNIVFALAGLAIIGLGVAGLVQINEITDLIQANLTGLSVAIIVLGSIIFIISSLACCGAIKESRCMLILYAVFMAVLAAGKIYIVVLIYSFLGDVITTVENWLNSAFRNENLRPVFNAMESLFSCCGTEGPSAYNGTLPGTCCGYSVEQVCYAPDAFMMGCNERVSSYFNNFGSAIGGVIIFVIVVEVVCMLFGSYMASRIKSKRKAHYA